MSQIQEKQTLNGLSDQEVIESRNKNGINLLTPPKRPSMWKRW